VSRQDWLDDAARNSLAAARAKFGDALPEDAEQSLEDAIRTRRSKCPTLAEFLLARIAEDQAVADSADGPDGIYPDTWWGQPGNKWADDRPVPLQDANHIARHDPARVLAECEAKRDIVEAFQRIETLASAALDIDQFRRLDAARREMRWVVRRLTVPYMWHPDYREEWRP
jgi:hypothetical protein